MGASWSGVAICQQYSSASCITSAAHSRRTWLVLLMRCISGRLEPITPGSLSGVLGGLSEEVCINCELALVELLIELSFRRPPTSDELYMSDRLGV